MSLPTEIAPSLGEKSRRDRRRLQNRTAQKVIRDNQSTNVRQLEDAIGQLEGYVRQLETAFKTTGRARRIRPTNGLPTQLRLITENQELREALRRMRRRLASYGDEAQLIAGMKEQRYQIHALLHTCKFCIVVTNRLTRFSHR